MPPRPDQRTFLEAVNAFRAKLDAARSPADKDVFIDWCPSAKAALAGCDDPAFAHWLYVLLSHIHAHQHLEAFRVEAEVAKEKLARVGGKRGRPGDVHVPDDAVSTAGEEPTREAKAAQEF